MPRLKPVDPHTIDEDTKQLLKGVRDKYGATTNMLQTMANSKAVLKAFMSFEAALAQGSLPPRLVEQIALTVAEATECGYCLAVHTAIGKAVGLSEEAILDSRRGQSPNSKDEAALQFARDMVTRQGWGRNQDLARLRKVGYGDTEVVEIIANVVLHLFTNYFNHAADTEIDFPRVAPLSSEAQGNRRSSGDTSRR